MVPSDSRAVLTMQKINYISGTPQPFFDLIQLAYRAKVDLLRRQGHGGAGLVPC